jgi:hypothetical protein
MDEKEKFEDWCIFYEMANYTPEEAKSQAACALAQEEGNGDSAGITARAREIATDMGFELDESLCPVSV